MDVNDGSREVDHERLDNLRRGGGPIQEHIIDELLGGKLTRRDFLRRGTAVGLSMPLLGGILEASGIPGVRTSSSRPVRLATGSRVELWRKGSRWRCARRARPTARPPADRVKTDKRDAIRLARLLAAGELTLVRIPSVEREQLRDLVRCREDIRQDLMRARHRIGKFLLRREIYWEGPGETWSRKHRSWLTSVRFSDHASRATLADYLHAHDVLIARRDQIEADLAELATCVACAHTV